MSRFMEELVERFALREERQERREEQQEAP